MKFKSIINKFLSNKRGNIAISVALSLIPIMLTIGAAVDYSRSSNLHNNVARATDAALLAAVSEVMKDTDLDDEAAVDSILNENFEPFFLANMYNAEPYEYNGYEIDYDPTTRDVSVKVLVDYKAAVTQVMGVDGWKTDVKAATTMRMSAGGAVSMFLVLDRSGSMSSSASSTRGRSSWRSSWEDRRESKMDSLQSAVKDLTTSLVVADPEKKYIRMGAVAFSSHMWAQQNLGWNLSDSNDYVQSMDAGGGTDSSDAIELAYTELKRTAEQTEHMEKNGQKPELIIVFMTDGANGSRHDDTSTINTCTAAKTYGMKIYTVAFRAPSRGEALLSSCASSPSHYFDPQDNNEMIAVFKAIGANVAESLVLSQ
ncbi:MAG: VWA domain-containing protein [Hyphomicrobiales bacterium]|nr:VWA domain-containing protein [Hyphomicrobiales bacterium]